MGSERVGFGLLGAGLIASFHARALQASGKAYLAAIADIDKDRLARLTAQFSCRGYSTLEEMLDDPQIAVVNILTPNHLHRDVTVKAARAGKHILVEKPPAMSLRDVDDMAEAGRAAAVTIGVMLQCRTRPAIQKVRTALAEGRFGKLYHADAYMKWFRSSDYYHTDPWRSSQQSGAGVTILQAFHYLDLLQYLGWARREGLRQNE